MSESKKTKKQVKGANVAGRLRRLDENRWEMPVGYKAGMRVPGVVFASEKLLRLAEEDKALEQVANVAFLPGIVRHSLAMPDIHWGYGFPVGGVAATRVDGGVISPGGIGYDINCGVRLLRTDLTENEVRPRLEKLVKEIFQAVPSGLGSEGAIRLSHRDLEGVLTRGAAWAVEAGYGEPEDLEMCEERGCLRGADPAKVPDKAIKRGMPQLGTLGSGNHFVEVQVVDEILDRGAATAMGIRAEGQVTVLIHTGSRGLGHQVCEGYLREMRQAVRNYGIALPDQQLACAPLDSPEGRGYYAAMAASANFAWANRQCISQRVRDAFGRVFGKKVKSDGLSAVYDVAHNIAKIEEHTVGSAREILCVHRKGATRAFPAGHPDLPARYRDVGQPVLIPGDMGRYSYVAVGTPLAMELSFGSCCHGAGRTMSRSEAKRTLTGSALRKQLAGQGIVVMSAAAATLVEEAPQAYKDAAEVVKVVEGAGIARIVARFRPIGVVKG
ncbi:MAG: RtcB family protein [Chloroflexota bacterium]|jgi:tRNA-splicing ligase RtcB